MLQAGIKSEYNEFTRVRKGQKSCGAKGEAKSEPHRTECL
jgi:hypothetical protein